MAGPDYVSDVGDVGDVGDEDLFELVSGEDEDEDDVSGVDYVGQDDPIALLESVSGDVGAARRAKSRKLALARKLLVAARSQAREKRAKELAVRARAMRQPMIRLGIDSRVSLSGTPIAPGAVATITTTAVDRMRLVDFQPRASIAQDFLIHDIRVQRTSLLSGAQPVPADHFLTPDRAPIETVALYPGTVLTMRVENTSAAPRHFQGTFSGIDLDVDK